MQPGSQTEPQPNPTRQVIFYVIAIVTYIPLGVAFRTVFLNWIVGPLYFVVVVATLTAVFDREGDE